MPLPVEIHMEDFGMDQKLNYFEIGFHGDQYLISLIFSLLKHADLFIETGASTGSSLVYTGRNFPELKCYSCEPREEAFNQARINSEKFKNIEITNIQSLDFLRDLVENGKVRPWDKCLFWLDAHGLGFEWPLQKELSFITSRFKKSWIFIDDFMVPDRPQFGYDKYNDQICNIDYIKDHLYLDDDHEIYVPSYTEKTSKHHPLRGWILIINGKVQEERNCLRKKYIRQIQLDSSKK